MPGSTGDDFLIQDAVFINYLLSLISGDTRLCQLCLCFFMQVVNLVVTASKGAIEEMEFIVWVID